MKKIITYGTFDLLHYGHINLLERAKNLGDHLTVAVSTDEFNWDEKKKKSYYSYEERIHMLNAIKYVDKIIPETNWKQKEIDIVKYDIDVFVIGDDWEGEFDYLKDKGVQIEYLKRTPKISTTKIKNDLSQNVKIQ